MDMDEMKEAVKLVYDLFTDEKLAKAIAEAYWNIYIEMKKKGFTADEAMNILSKMNLGGGK